MNPPEFGLPQGAWACGNQFIASNGAVLPPFCVKCGRAAAPDRLRKTFSWQPRWVYVFILLALLIYIIVALALRKSMALQIPLCFAHREKYRTLRLAGAILAFGSIPEMIAGIAILPDRYMGLAITGSLCALLAGLVVLAAGSILRVKRIDKYYGYFGGAHEAFLAQLPPPPSEVMLVQ